MAAHQQEKPKKSFEFRMSKKVAELTQVVHMLFTRNHEKEVEIEALKKSYEHEIELVLEDARSRIGKLENKTEELTRQAVYDLDQARRAKESEMVAKEVEWRQKWSDSEKLLHEERSECQNLRDLLINAQRDIEKLRQGVTEQLTSNSDEQNRKEKELERLRSQLAASENLLKEAQRDAQNVISELQKTNEKLDNDVRQLHTVMENSHKTRDQLLARNKQLESDMKTLKREFNKRVQEMVNNQLKNNKTNQSQDTNEELERLRREIQRYRLELSNRDYNFNRMFTEKQPMVVNQRTASSSQKQSPIYTFSHSNGNSALPHSAGPMPSPSSQVSSGSSQNMPTFLKDRPQTQRNNFMDQDKSSGQLDRQTTFHERLTTQEGFLSINNQEKLASIEPRPRTQGPAFMHEGIFSNNRHLRQSHSISSAPVVHTDDPHQLLPKKPVSVQQSNDRPISSSLPSICSTPDQRRLATQLTKPKPLPREMLYGK